MPIVDETGDVVARIKLTVSGTKGLAEEQGAEDTYTVLNLDNICVEGTIVAINNVPFSQNFRIYPNPTHDKLNIEMPFEAQSGMSLQIVNLTGQVIMEKKVELDNDIQTIEAVGIVDGMYLLQIISDGRIIALNKFVKM